MENLYVIGITLICCVAIVTSIFIIRTKNRRKAQARSANYEILLGALRREIDAQVELVQALTEAVELANKNKESSLDVLVKSVGNTARDRLVVENEKMKSQLAFYNEIENKRNLEFGAPHA